ncbi:MAG TPA: MBL fold metallo-hydrolase [Candidatus Olsenella pullistercoris]|uniref:MBL fold metallo-hydrolase n=1 Tax=Candidatus Olsenella pullistercoris TaxID=2838712 RepID=A0A9D2JEA7_9ACTN|nr:MBL fold metallo-hydrolase [Candidatus Olsenella pullistercoris]
MRATVLMENSTPSSRLLARHGLSLWLELADGRRILFDMGPDEGFIANARTLGVDVTTADAAVLSHGHYDHGGGLPAFLSACAAAGRDVPVYVREGSFDEHVSGTHASRHAIGIDPELARDPRVRVVSERHDLGDGLTLFSTSRRAHPSARSNARLLRRCEDGRLAPDDFAHEQSLLVREGGRLILVSGCSHGGVLNIMDAAEGLAGAPLDAVLAGMHLMDPSGGSVEDACLVRELARELDERGVRCLTFHCTGIEAFSILRDRLGERVGYLHVGSRVDV